MSKTNHRDSGINKLAAVFNKEVINASSHMTKVSERVAVCVGYCPIGTGSKTLSAIKRE